MLGTVGAAVGGLLLLVAIPGLVAGIGLLSRASWLRVLSLVLAAYSVFVLSQQTAIEAFGACCSIEDGRLQATAA